MSTVRPSARTPLWVGGLLGVAFSCGIVFGKQDAKAGQAQAADMEQTVGALLDEADRSAERYEDIKEKLRLTFHEELKKAAPVVPVASVAPPPVPRKPAPKAHEPAHAPAPKAAQGPVEDRAAEPAPPKAAPKPAEKPATVEDELAALKKTIAARVQVAAAPQAEPKPAPQPAPVPAAEARPHFVQVASFPEPTAAQRLVDKLNGAGISARVSAFDLGGGRTAHRVLTGTAPSKEAADALAARVKAATGLSGLVRRQK